MNAHSLDRPSHTRWDMNKVEERTDAVVTALEPPVITP